MAVVVFAISDLLGTIRKVLRYVLTNDIRMGIRPHTGPNRGQLEWRSAARDTVADILRHPLGQGACNDEPWGSCGRESFF